MEEIATEKTTNNGIWSSYYLGISTITALIIGKNVNYLWEVTLILLNWVTLLFAGFVLGGYFNL